MELHKNDFPAKEIARVLLTRRVKILLGQLNSNGDCLYATTVARQIKKDYPECRLTWAIGSMCRTILDGNPYVDEIWEIPLANIAEVAEVWPRFEQEALARKKRGDFDEVFFTQIAPSNLHNYDGTIRSSIFRAYPHPITVPVAPVLKLMSSEVKNVRRFAESHHLADMTHVILFECSSKSGQSFVTPEFAIEVAHKLIIKIPALCVILSSNTAISSKNDRIIDGSVLSFRENAELTKYCSLFIGCSSGISWLCTSDWAKPLPMIQLIKRDTIWFASVVCDHEQWNLLTDNIIEMSDCSPGRVSQCALTVIHEEFSVARKKFHEIINIPFTYYDSIQQQLLREGKFINSLIFLTKNIKKHGFHSLFFLCPLGKLLEKSSNFLKGVNCDR